MRFLPGLGGAHLSEALKQMSFDRKEGHTQTRLKRDGPGVLQRNHRSLFSCTASRTAHVGPSWILMEPSSPLARDLNPLRPGRGPQPVTHAGMPREVLTRIWDELGVFRGVQINEMTITATDRDTLDNTLIATWADRPSCAQSHISLQAAGQREVQGKQESIQLSFEGRFEEVRSVLSPIWPFERQRELDITIMVRLTFDSPISLGDNSLETYRTALMNANQGNVEVRVVPARVHRQRGA